MNVVMRSSNAPATLAGAVKQQIHELNPDLPLYNVSTMSSASIVSWRAVVHQLMLGDICCNFSWPALIGIMPHRLSVGQGNREVGIRLALALHAETS